MFSRILGPSSAFDWSPANDITKLLKLYCFINVVIITLTQVWIVKLMLFSLKEQIFANLPTFDPILSYWISVQNCPSLAMDEKSSQSKTSILICGYMGDHLALKLSPEGLAIWYRMIMASQCIDLYFITRLMLFHYKFERWIFLASLFQIVEFILFFSNVLT